MPFSLSDLHFAASLNEMSDEEFLLAWQAEVVANDEQNARHRRCPPIA